ncbi:MAG: BatD family protein [Candidatus Riflebacteria bacterium]|nr:BatD family protein [Candidatus Riflebacteria bacterium]
MRNFKIAFFFMLFLFICGQRLLAAGFSIDARVDRSEISAGESLNLVITITQSLTSGRAQRINVPAVQSIPGFDIASTRSGQSTRFINGVGETQSQVVYELVPQKPGKVVIPAFSFKDSDGEEHTSKSIEITVRPPDEEPETPAAEEPVAAAEESNNSLFKGLLFVGLILGCIVALPFVLSAFFNRNVKPSTRWEQASANGAVASGVVSASNVEEAVLVDVPAKEVLQRIDFNSSVARLKREYPEADTVFYRKYFELFRTAALGCSVSLRADMTADELFRKVYEIAVGESVSQATGRLAADLEKVMYANSAPSRAFSAIDADAREIINAISE